MSEQQGKYLAGPKILLMGPTGTGKTYSLGTLGDWCQAHGKTLFVLGLDQGIEALFGYWTDPPPRGKGQAMPAAVHWKQQLTSQINLTRQLAAVDKVGRLSYAMLCKLIDSERGGDNNPFWKILQTCAKPISDRDGKEFPPVDKWDSSMVFAIDGLTELSNAAMKMQIGANPTADRPDYGVAQNNLMNFLRLCAQGSQYTFVLISHVQRSINEVTNTTNVTVNTVGQAICAEIPPMFSDVIYTVREGSEFTWDTSAYGVDTKTRSLGYRNKIQPNFAQIMDLWQARGGK
jgi:hypothetical protein